MIRTLIKPTESNFNLHLNIPDEYIGEELELIVFKKKEGFVEEKPVSKIKFSEKYRGKFTKNDALNFNKHTQKMRNEWNNI